MKKKMIIKFYYVILTITFLVLGPSNSQKTKKTVDIVTHGATIFWFLGR